LGKGTLVNQNYMQSPLAQLLIAEHDVILEAGNLISLNGNLWKSKPSEYERTVRQLLDFFSAYADKYHHHKEEEILFPAISKKSEIASAGIVTELTEHHEEFRLLMQQIHKALDRNDFAATQIFFESYISKLKDHIAAENDELFPMAENIFSPDELEKLFYKCIDKDGELGTIRKEELVNLIKKLERDEAV
jgi:hemerythrin-like domain-containing protein